MCVCVCVCVCGADALAHLTHDFQELLVVLALFRPRHDDAVVHENNVDVVAGCTLLEDAAVEDVPDGAVELKFLR